MPHILEQWKVLPHGPLVEIDDRLLTVTGDIPMPLGNFPRRMTVIGLRGNRTAIWSAIALPEPEMARIEALGRPAVLIVPNAGHRLDARIWKDRYPDIQVLTPAGARKDVSEVVPVDATDDVMDDADVRFMIVAGSEDKECALEIKRAGGTSLITNDVIGHVRHPHGLGAKVMATLMHYGTSEPAIPFPARFYVKDKPALARQLLGWAEIADLRRIIVSHGDPIEDEPAATLRRLAHDLDHDIGVDA